MGEYGSGLKLGSTHSFPVEYSAWQSLDISKHFEQALALPCWLENSSKASALADMYFGAGQRLRNFAVIHIEYGIGGGLILERRHYRGTLGRAAEFGGLYPYEQSRPSGRDLLLFLAERMKKPPTLIRDLVQADIPDALIAEWIERVGPQLLELSRHLSIALDIEAIVLNGLLPLPVFTDIARMLREQLPRSIPPGLSVPEIIVSQHAKSGLELGAASLPLHFKSSAASDKT
jgi:predicted NBD/HSP70 family sugar kinase